MMPLVDNTLQKNNKDDFDQASALQLAETYNGRRVCLRKLVDTQSISSLILEAHTALMLEKNRRVMNGVLYELEIEGKTGHLLGTCHARLIKMKDLPNTQEGLSEFICEIIHPVTMSILKDSNLYVEFDIKNPTNIEKMQSFTIEPNINYDLIVSRKKRTKMIERTVEESARRFGLDIALMEQQYKDAKPVYSLETAEEQMEASKAHYSSQKIEPENFLFSAEHDLEAIDAVQWGNLESMTELVKDLPEGLKLINAKRNKKMTDRVFEKLSSGEKDLFAVGATHLAGEEGMLSLLEGRGVQIRQIHQPIANESPLKK